MKNIYLLLGVTSIANTSILSCKRCQQLKREWRVSISPSVALYSASFSSSSHSSSSSLEERWGPTWRRLKIGVAYGTNPVKGYTNLIYFSVGFFCILLDFSWKKRRIVNQELFKILLVLIAVICWTFIWFIHSVLGAHKNLICFPPKCVGLSFRTFSRRESKLVLGVIKNSEWTLQVPGKKLLVTDQCVDRDVCVWWIP